MEVLSDGLFARRINGKWYGCRYHDDIKMLSVLTKADSMADAVAKLYLMSKPKN